MSGPCAINMTPPVRWDITWPENVSVMPVEWGPLPPKSEYMNLREAIFNDIIAAMRIPAEHFKGTGND